MQDFTKLAVWHDSRELVVEIYEATRHFPVEERYGLTAQMRRAAVSISSNIAEGCGRFSPAEFGHFLQIGIGSASELISQIEISKRLRLIHAESSVILVDRTDMVRRKLIRLRREVLGNHNPTDEVALGINRSDVERKT